MNLPPVLGEGGRLLPPCWEEERQHEAGFQPAMPELQGLQCLSFPPPHLVCFLERTATTWGAVAKAYLMLLPYDCVDMQSGIPNPCLVTDPRPSLKPPRCLARPIVGRCLEFRVKGSQTGWEPMPAAAECS